MAKKKGSKKKASKKRAKKPAKPLYDVIVDGGNLPGDTLSTFDDLGAVAERCLVDQRMREVTLKVRAKMVQGELGAERADGVAV